MCGIAGGPAALVARALPRALDRLEFRGPDARGIAELGGNILGVQRLAITDLEAQQPIVRGTASGRVAIVFNGNLSEADELRARLARRGLTPETENDAELALLAYIADGVRGLADLGGPFALAIADERSERLVLARDRFGEKPLFVERAAGARPPRFASTVAALRALLAADGDGAAERDLRVARRDARRFARLGWLPLEESCFGWPMHAMPPGTIRVFERDGRSVDHELAPMQHPERSLARSLEHALRGRANADRPVGLFLSGGIDSALLAATLVRIERSVLCFSLDFAGGVREAERAAHVARALGHEHVRATLGSEALLQLAPLVEQSGLPHGDPSVLAVQHLAKRARAEGVVVILGGEGADEFFAGYRRMHAWPWIKGLRRVLPRGVRAWLSRVDGNSTWARARRALRFADYGELWSLTSSRVLDRVFGEAGEGARVPFAQPGGPRRWETENYLLGDLLPKLDLGGHAAGVETRAPYLDAEVAAHAWGGIDRALRVTHVERKPELRAMLARSLPRRLCRGPKRGFGPPVASWIAEQRGFVEDALAHGDALFDVSAARALLHEVVSGESKHGHFVFCLLSLALSERAAAPVAAA